MSCMAETRSLTAWPAQQWKPFLHDFILTGDVAFEKMNVTSLGMVFTFPRKQQSASDNSAAPYLVFALATCLLSHGMPWEYIQNAKQTQDYIQKDNKQFVFVLPLNLKNPNSASKIPKRLRQWNHSAAIWINGEDESRITFLHAFETACTFFERHKCLGV